MASFKKTCEMIAIAYAEKLLTDEEFLFLYEANKPVNLELPYYEYEELNLEENISEAECKTEFRFERGDIERLPDVLQLPPTFECPQGSVCDRIEGLCILLRRLTYPCRYSDMVSRFARPVPVLCMICNIVLNYIYDLHHRKITAWNQAILNPLVLQQYADAASDKGLSHDLYHYNNNIEVIIISCLSDKKGERLIKRQISVKCNFIKSNKLSTKKVLQNP